MVPTVAKDTKDISWKKCELGAQYVYQDSRFLAPFVYFAITKPICLWAVLAEQHAQYIWFWPQTSQEGNKSTLVYHYIREAKNILS